MALFRRQKRKQSLCEHQRGTEQSISVAAEPCKKSASSNPDEIQNDISIDGAPRGQQAVEKHAVGPAEKASSAAAVEEVGSPCQICKENRRARRRYAWKLIAGLFLPFSLQAMDATVIASALPFIASDFNQLSQLNWIISAFNLTSATFIPAWGQFADIFGRHAALQAAIVLMLFGSALCSGSPTSAFAMLLFGRALQGISCAGINVLTHIILADKVSLKENARNNTIFALVGGLGYGAGPAIGGYLTAVNWRWVFIINLPVAALGIVVVFFILRPELLGPQNVVAVESNEEIQSAPTLRSQLATIDYGGQFLFLFGIGMLILALTWGGSYYPWTDIKVLAPLIIGSILSISFLVWEYLMMPGRALALKFPRQMAMLPIRLIWSRNAGILIYINFTAGMAMFAVFYFVTIYFAIVLGDGPDKSGIQLLYYTPGLGVGAYMAMFVCNIYPRQTWFPLAFGTLIEPLGITILAIAIGQDNKNLIYGMLAFTGVGTGIRFMPGTLHGVGYFPNDIASIMSLMTLAVSLGGTFGLTLMFTVFNNTLENAGINFKPSSTSSSFEDITNLSADSLKYVRDNTRTAVVVSFYAASAFLWLGVVAMAYMGNVRITNRGKGLEGDGKKDFSENVVVKGSFLGSLVRRRRAVPGREKGIIQEPAADETGHAAV